MRGAGDRGCGLTRNGSVRECVKGPREEDSYSLCAWGWTLCGVWTGGRGGMSSGAAGDVCERARGSGGRGFIRGVRGRVSCGSSLISDPAWQCSATCLRDLCARSVAWLPPGLGCLSAPPRHCQPSASHRPWPCIAHPPTAAQQPFPAHHCTTQPPSTSNQLPISSHNTLGRTSGRT